MCCHGHRLFTGCLVTAIIGQGTFFSQTDPFLADVANVANGWVNRSKCQAEETHFAVMCLLFLNNVTGSASQEMRVQVQRMSFKMK